MSRITGHLVSQETHPCGRLVMHGDYDTAEQILTFLVPSLSRGHRVYAVELDCFTGEIGCPCEALSDFREAYRMPYRWEAAAAPAEVLARAKDKRLLPLITRAPRNLCPHARKVRLAIQRHGLMEHFRQREEWLIELLEAMNVKTA